MTRVTFRSKVDWWLLAVLVAAAAGSLAALAALAAESLRQALAFSPVLLLSVGLPIWLLRTTTYTLDDELLVRSGPFTWHVPLREIRVVRPTRNPLSSPALSLDRLRIEYGRRAIMISPDDKTRFLEELQKRLPRPLTATIRP